MNGGEFAATTGGAVMAFGVGLAFAVVTINMYLAFGLGAPISVVSPIVRLAGLLLVSVIGVAALGEPITLRYVIGVVMSVTGVVLIVFR
jgi:transporter family protein